MTLYYAISVFNAIMTPSDRPPQGAAVPPDDDAFRVALRGVLERSGRSMRQLSGAMGRDPGYVAALLDPTRPSRARPTPADLLRASDETGIPFVELLEALWGISASRLARELAAAGSGVPLGSVTEGLTAAELAEVRDFAAFVAGRRSGGRRTSR
jgi:hypothetical protein